MTIALGGLMGIQIYWIRNASSVKEANFRRSVNEAITKVVSKVELLEKRRSIEKSKPEGLLNINPHLPYDEFLNKNILDSLISRELNLRGIDTRFEFGVYKPENEAYLVENSSRKDTLSHYSRATSSLLPSIC